MKYEEEIIKDIKEPLLKAIQDNDSERIEELINYTICELSRYNCFCKAFEDFLNFHGLSIENNYKGYKQFLIKHLKEAREILKDIYKPLEIEEESELHD